ncbi:unnamed protein product, partial [Prorocentrum cordatum]
RGRARGKGGNGDGDDDDDDDERRASSTRRHLEYRRYASKFTRLTHSLLAPKIPRPCWRTNAPVSGLLTCKAINLQRQEENGRARYASREILDRHRLLSSHGWKQMSTWKILLEPSSAYLEATWSACSCDEGYCEARRRKQS